ncbi:MAG: Gfo/Idh/MocA family oxidoreductase [Bacteroidales bacterium]|nr:Gfo/Idh/MocA family oxidoreductase [Bacteroidales bacterium]
MKLQLLSTGLALLLLSACTQAQKQETTAKEGKVKIINLDPGHFHAALVQKTMYDEVDRVVHVYAPEGPEVKSYLNRISDYNSRQEDPTDWEEKVYTGSDFLEKMLSEKPGNMMVVSGNNALKTEYILRTIQSGIHVLADKPMVISPGNYPMLEEAFATAREKGVLLYDIMTERHEITTLLQKELSQIPEVFGELQKGTQEVPAITKESVHHFSKIVSGKPLVRPPWFFDVAQQGEGIVDVTTHLVDLVQWEAFPEVVLKKSDVEIVSARRWTTDLTPAMFEKVTGLDSYPEYLSKDVEDDLLKVFSNGEINYTLKGVHAKVSVIWNFVAPKGTGDTHYSVMRGTRCNLTIRQGEAEGYKPKLYIEATHVESPEEFTRSLEKAMEELAVRYPGISLKELEEFTWLVEIPDSYKVGHEAHFGQVTQKFLGYLAAGTLPEWEIPNMIVKYYTTTEGMKKAMEP